MMFSVVYYDLLKVNKYHFLKEFSQAKMFEIYTVILRVMFEKVFIRNQ